MTTNDKIKFHHDNKKFARIIRQVSEDLTEVSREYIVDHSKDFIILQETDDFKVFGYFILPTSQIREVRFNSHDKFYDKIINRENEINKVLLPHKVDLTNWQTISNQ